MDKVCHEILLPAVVIKYSDTIMISQIAVGREISLSCSFEGIVA